MPQSPATRKKRIDPADWVIYATVVVDLGESTHQIGARLNEYGRLQENEPISTRLRKRPCLGLSADIQRQNRLFNIDGLPL